MQDFCRSAIEMSMRRFLLGTLLTAGLLAFISQALSLAGVGAPNSISAQAANREAVNEAAIRLNSPRFAEREAASKELIEARAPAVAALLEVAKTGSLEAAVRSVGILEAIYVSCGEFEENALEELWWTNDDLARAYLWLDVREAQTTADAAEFALDELERTARPAVVERAAVVLESHYDIRERRAIAEIERLHGKALFGETSTVLLWNARVNPAPLPNELQKDSARGRGELTMIVIGPKWSGGDEGLKHVARLKRLHKLYRIEGSQVTDNGIMRLAAAVPGLEIEVRAAAKLGIEHRPDPMSPAEGCKIDAVKLGEAAANAGLRSRDIILRFAGERVVDFNSLITILHRHNPGDKVEAIITRDEVPMTVELTLTGWD
jgi:hypothetical protein